MKWLLPWLAHACPGPVCPHILPSPALCCLQGMLTPTDHYSQTLMAAGFSLGLAKGRHPQSIEGKQKRKVKMHLPLPFHQCGTVWCICASSFSGSGPLGSRLHRATLALRFKQHPLLVLNLQPRMLVASFCC